MNLLKSMLVLSIPGFLTAARMASAELEKEFRASNVSKAELKTIGGSIAIKYDASLAPGQVVMRYSEESSASCSVAIEQTGELLRLSVTNSSVFGSWFVRSCENQIELTTGGLNALEVSSVSARIDADDKVGPLRASTVNGNVVSRSSQAELLKTINGSIESTSSLAPQQVKSVNGRIDIKVKGQSEPFKSTLEVDTVNSLVSIQAAKSVVLKLLNHSMTGSVENLQSTNANATSELNVIAHTKSGHINLSNVE